MSAGKNEKATFVVKILNQQNANWQGRITWLDENKEVYFRSTLEMIMLMSSALSPPYSSTDGEEENHREFPQDEV